jgi:hypothetical protein
LIKSTAKVPFTAPLESGVMLPVNALVFASKLPPIVSGQFTVTCALVTVNASSARAAAGASAFTRRATPNRQIGRTFLIAFPPLENAVTQSGGATDMPRGCDHDACAVSASTKAIKDTIA